MGVEIFFFILYQIYMKYWRVDKMSENVDSCKIYVIQVVSLPGKQLYNKK